MTAEPGPPFNNGLGELDIDGVAVSVGDPNTIYAISSAGKHLWRSEDAGLTWRNRVLPDNCGASSIALDPGDHDRVYVSGCKGVKRSDDGGVTWTSIGPSATNPIAFNVMRSVPQHIYFADGEKLYRSTNRGDSTESRPNLVKNEAQIGLAYDVARLVGHSQNYQAIYAVTEGEGVFRSLDRGSTWTARNHQLPNQGHGLEIPAIAVDPHDGDHLVVSTVRSSDKTIEPLHAGEKGLFRSLDGGATWTDITANFDPSIDVLSAAILPDGSGTPVIGPPTAFGTGSLRQFPTGVWPPRARTRRPSSCCVAVSGSASRPHRL